MKKIQMFFIMTVALICASIPSFVRATNTPTVIISEIAWAGSSLSSADEWLELTNVTDHPIDVSGWTLEGASSTPLSLPANSIIESHSTYLISNYDNPNKNSTLNTKPQFVTTAVSLPNDKLSITLFNIQHEIIDSAGNSGTPFQGRSGNTGGSLDGRFQSMERANAMINGTQKDAWLGADVSVGFKEGVLDQGTPGSINSFLSSALSVPTEPTPDIIPPTNDNLSLQTEPVITDPPTTNNETSVPENICEDVIVVDIAPPTINESPTETAAPLLSAEQPKLEQIDSTTEQPVVQTISLASVIQPSGQKLKINELYPRPATDEPEWVELVNEDVNSIVTNGWTLTDASGTTTNLPDGVVSPGAYLIIENPKGKLNNDGDSVSVKNEQGAVVDAVLYNSDIGSVPAIGESLIRTGTNTLALTTTPTRDMNNIATARVVINTTIPTSSTTSATNDAAVVATNSQTTVPSTSLSTQATSTKIEQVQNPISLVTNTLHLSELYPDTNGQDVTKEFIEIQNDGNIPITLAEWSLTDASGTRFTFTNADVIQPHSYLAVMRPQSHIVLNNTGDTVTLFAPDKTAVDTQSYEKAKTSFAFANTNGVWIWTSTPTPNESNRASENNTPTTQTIADGTKTTSNAVPSPNAQRSIPALLLTIANAKEAKNGTRITVKGLVTVLPNIFQSQIMYIQDETGGIQIFKNDCRFPTLAEGQSVTVTGTLSHINGEARLKISNQSIIETGVVTELLTPNELNTENTNASIGSLMMIAGTVISRTANQAFVDVNGKKWTVNFPKNASLNSAVFEKGANVRVAGVIAKSKNNMLIKPRSDQDIKILNKPESPTLTTVSGKMISQTQKQTVALTLLILSLIAFVALKLRPRIYSLIKSYGHKSTLRP